MQFQKTTTDKEQKNFPFPNSLLFKIKFLMRSTQYLRARAGFTLMEMLIVVIILGILAVLVVPQYTKTIEHAKAKEAISNLKLIAAAEGIYRLENKYYYPISAVFQMEDDLTVINTALRLDIPNEINWNYTVNASYSAGGQYIAYAYRQGSGGPGGYLNCSYNISGTPSGPSIIPEPVKSPECP